MREAGQRLMYEIQGGKKAAVIYLGDHDPSGIDMTRDVEERLNMFAESEPGTIEVRRIALNMDQVKKYKPPENPAKVLDPRAGDYIDRFGTSSWELDALEPKLLAKLVQNEIWTFIDDDEWGEAERKQQRGRDFLRETANNYTEKAE